MAFTRHCQILKINVRFKLSNFWKSEHHWYLRQNTFTIFPHNISDRNQVQGKWSHKIGLIVEVSLVFSCKFHSKCKNFAQLSGVASCDSIPPSNQQMAEAHGISSSNSEYQGLLVARLLVARLFDWLSNVGENFPPIGLPILGVTFGSKSGTWAHRRVHDPHVRTGSSWELQQSVDS